MTLREQLLRELKDKNKEAQKSIKYQESVISSNTGGRGNGILAAAADAACSDRIKEAHEVIDSIKRQNSWVSEMLTKYNGGKG